MSGKKIIQGLREAAEHAKASNKGVVPSRDTSDDLALSQLLELSKKATPGPWETTSDDRDGYCLTAEGWPDWNPIGWITPKEDAAFIVAAVNYVRTLESKSGDGSTPTRRGKRRGGCSLEGEARLGGRARSPRQGHGRAMFRDPGKSRPPCRERSRRGGRTEATGDVHRCPGKQSGMSYTPLRLSHAARPPPAKAAKAAKAEARRPAPSACFSDFSRFSGPTLQAARA